MTTHDPGGRTLLRRSGMTAVVMAAVLAAPALSFASPPAPAASLVVTPGREFAADSYVHRPLGADLARHPLSDAFVASLVRQVRAHGAAVNIDRYAPPIWIVGADTPTVRVVAGRHWEPGWVFQPLQRQWMDVPLPDGFRPSDGTDREAVIYQPSTGRYWEFWFMEPTGGTVRDSAGRPVREWRAAWGGHSPRLADNPGYFPKTPEGFSFGVAATGLVLLAGTMTIAEQRRGEIGHALHIALPQARRGAFVHPAQRTDGTLDAPDAIPQGTTFRFPVDLDLERIEMDPYARMIARAVQRHGMVVRDTAGAVAFYAENPVTRPGEPHPYFGPGGILNCPGGQAVPACYPDHNNRLAGFPWDRLEAVEPAAR